MRQYSFLLAVSIILVSVLAILLVNVVRQAMDYVSPTCLELIHAEPKDSGRDIGTICRNVRKPRG